MTAPFPSLVRFYVRSVYAFGGGAKAAPGATGTVKRALKKIGIGLLAILLAADFGVVFVAMDWAMYEALKPAGLQDLLLLNAAVGASLVVFLLGFVTALSTYCMSQAETSLLALPIKPRDLLGAKFAMVYLSEAAFAFLLMAIAVVIYGINESPPFFFYIKGIVAALALPLVPLSLAYFLLVPFMSLARFLRNKNAVMIVGGLIGMVFALLFNIYIQSTMPRLQDAAWLLKNLAGPGSRLQRLGHAYPPAFLAASSLTSESLAGAGLALANILSGLAAALLAAFALGPAYARSILGFDESRFKRLSAVRPFIARTFGRGGADRALFLREWRLMNREPVYFLNGPMIVFLMPVIMGIVFTIQKESFSELLTALGGMRSGSGMMLAAAAAGAFLGTGTSITCTAVSRDAKAISWIKALPLRYSTYMRAKFLHGFAFSILGSLIGALSLGLALGLPAPEIAGALFMALAFSAFVDLAGLMIDAARPRLSWDNPATAMKQNPNSIFVILGVMGLLAGLGALAAALPLGKAGFVALYGGFFSAAFALLAAVFPRFMERKIEALES